MSLLSKTTFGSVYRIETQQHVSPTWHGVQCAVLGLSDRKDDEMQYSDEMQVDDTDTATVSRCAWIVKWMDPRHHIGCRAVSTSSRKNRTACTSFTTKHGLQRLQKLGLADEDDGKEDSEERGTKEWLFALSARDCEVLRSEEQRIGREVALHANVNFRHDNILPTALALQNSTGCGMIVFADKKLIDLFEYCCGTSPSSAADLVNCDTGVPPPSDLTLVSVFRQVCSALAFLHNTFNLVHNDVKPENILVCPKTGKCYLSDFGGTTSKSSTGGYALVTASRFFVAPERVRQESFDERADSWSLGMLCCELLAHQTAYTDDSRIFTHTPLYSCRFSVNKKCHRGNSKRNPFEQTFTRDRWQRLMLQNFAEPLTNALWQRKLQPRDSRDSECARWFLERTLRMRAENRCSATDLLLESENWVQ